jgi:starvation-inducible DNA-binding protein
MPRTNELVERQRAPLTTPSDIEPEAVRDITEALNALLADVFTLYFKTKNFHWHMSGPHFRDYHLLLDDHGNQLFAMTDDIAERVVRLAEPLFVPSNMSLATHCRQRRGICSSS